MKKLEPFTGKIDFHPSYRQYLVMQMLEPNRCDKCGGELEMRTIAFDSSGNPIKSHFVKIVQLLTFQGLYYLEVRVALARATLVALGAL